MSYQDPTPDPAFTAGFEEWKSRGEHRKYIHRPAKKKKKKRKQKRQAKKQRTTYLWHEKFTSYSDYLKSSDWRSVRRMYRRDKTRLQECLSCGNKEFQLHHKSYARCGTDALKHLIPLCGNCHVTLHEILDEHGWPVTKTKAAMIEMCGWKPNEVARQWGRLRVNQRLPDRRRFRVQSLPRKTAVSQAGPGEAGVAIHPPTKPVSSTLESWILTGSIPGENKPRKKSKRRKKRQNRRRKALR